MSILDDVKNEVASMDPDAVKAELAKMLTAKAKRQEAQKARNADPAQKAKREEYSKQYRERVMSDPDRAAQVIAKRKEYMNRPENKEKRKAYQKTRNARMKELAARAKELGLIDDAGNLVAAGQ